MNIRFFLLCLATLFTGLICLMGVSSYHYYQAIHADDPITPEVVIDEGSATVIRGTTAYDMTR